MVEFTESTPIIAIIGLGYVGLPLAVAFSKKYPQVIGFDVDEKKVSSLKKGKSIISELTYEELTCQTLQITSDPLMLQQANILIVAVPTPVDNNQIPDLSFLESASELVGKHIKKGATVVFESTVYPGATEEVCVPLIELHSGLTCGVDWKVGYSPERINPGDKEHTLAKIIKIVSGMDKETTEFLAKVYGKVVQAGIHKAPNIKTAEAAKVIENIQRDLNIALMNELSIIFEKLNLDTKDVLEAAGTKWNFHKYTPGLVGGHCIGVDPYYLTYKAKQLGHQPEVILAGRRINDAMGKRVAGMTIKALNEVGKAANRARVHIFGLTFKENVADPRNSRIVETIQELKRNGVQITASDPLLTGEEIMKHFTISFMNFEQLLEVDAIILATVHNQFKMITLDQLNTKMQIPILIDIKGFFNKDEAKEKGFVYKRF